MHCYRKRCGDAAVLADPHSRTRTHHGGGNLPRQSVHGEPAHFRILSLFLFLCRFLFLRCCRLVEVVVVEVVMVEEVVVVLEVVRQVVLVVLWDLGVVLVVAVVVVWEDLLLDLYQPVPLDPEAVVPGKVDERVLPWVPELELELELVGYRIEQLVLVVVVVLFVWV